MAKRKVFDDFDPAPAGPSISETLRATRMAHGYDLREVAAMLRIRYPYLLAIEEGRFQDLPGSTYAIGFLRSYAEALGLDPDAVVARYKEEAAGTVRRQELYLPTPAAEGRASGGTLLLGTLVLAGIVYGGWYYLSATDRSVADFVPTLPDRLVSLLDGVPTKPETAGGTAPSDQQQTVAGVQPPAQAPTQPPAQAPAQTSVQSPAGGSPAALTPPADQPPSASQQTAAGTPPATTAAPAGQASGTVPAARPPAGSAVPGRPATVAALPPAAPSASPSAASSGMTNVPPPPSEDDEDDAPEAPTPLNAAAPPPAAPAAPPAPAAETVPANGKVYGTLNTNAKLILKATQDSWLQVRDGSEIVFTRVLKPGDTFRVPDKPNVKIRTGNAGGLVVMADGAESPPLGSTGQVLRDVSIDSHGLVRR
ncbi:helix-turn-helix domain-containing protein [Azospirillum picis]|uniref:Cytoskeletal protein RodZ n=1 Tax=Azospirillum picis TaxID=488438 RepID=A0ABU0MK75_9PROT|nr:helix-turn-helix domain-containing protein [Azospirillum picis]MBP2299981.1 cytoskeletal protein RodZ [Azospirillum picis]MDQ0533781.1 cytoskeletal protein RodZ [Azospirillum picis]